MNKIKQILTLILLIVITLVPFIHKVNGEFPPGWFMNKFSDTILNIVPFGLEISFFLIVALELIAPLLMFFVIYKIITASKFKKVLDLGFTIYYILFIILTFGSFLVEDYTNGFKDFVYFVGIVAIDKIVFKTKEDNY